MADIGLLYQFDLAGWRASASLDASYIERHDVTLFAGAATIQYAGKITSGLGSYTHWRGLGTVHMDKDRWTGVYTTQYIGSADDIIAAPGTPQLADQLRDQGQMGQLCRCGEPPP